MKARLITSGVLVVAAVVLAFLATQVSTDLTKQRHDTCNGLLPMPGSAYVLGWCGVGAAATAAVLVLVRWSRSGWRTTRLVLSLLALVFAGFVVYTVYGDAPTTRWLCSG